MPRAIGIAVLRRHPPIPKIWLMTDERLGEELWRAIERLPRGGGIVFRHYATPAAERRMLFRRVVRLARARGLIVVRAGERCGFGEKGTHGPARRTGGLRTLPAHSRAEAMAAIRLGADAVFVSPVFATDSHPRAPSLGRKGARRIAQGLPVRAIALGGMNARRFRGLHEFYGWAAIGAWV
jgi:thiamine-phosphate pyrophosphorylase